MPRVALTGTASYLGGRILRRLVDARGADAVVAVDIAPPPAALQGVRHRMVDLTLPGADHDALFQRVYQTRHLACAAMHGDFAGIRLSPHVYNTLAEVDAAAQALAGQF